MAWPDATTATGGGHYIYVSNVGTCSTALTYSSNHISAPRYVPPVVLKRRKDVIAIPMLTVSPIWRPKLRMRRHPRQGSRVRWRSWTGRNFRRMRDA